MPVRRAAPVQCRSGGTYFNKFLDVEPPLLLAPFAAVRTLSSSSLIAFFHLSAVNPGIYQACGISKPHMQRRDDHSLTDHSPPKGNSAILLIDLPQHLLSRCHRCHRRHHQHHRSCHQKHSRQTCLDRQPRHRQRHRHHPIAENIGTCANRPCQAGTTFKARPHPPRPPNPPPPKPPAARPPNPPPQLQPQPPPPPPKMQRTPGSPHSKKLELLPPQTSRQIDSGSTRKYYSEPFWENAVLNSTNGAFFANHLPISEGIAASRGFPLFPTSTPNRSPAPPSAPPPPPSPAAPSSPPPQTSPPDSP